jgi:hypothetical protein
MGSDRGGLIEVPLGTLEEVPLGALEEVAEEVEGGGDEA